MDRVVKTEAEWRSLLTPAQFEITRQRGTERSCSGPYWNNHQAGLYRCLCCDLDLFQSDAKFESRTGWPSFFTPVDESHISHIPDDSHGMQRTEICCARCDAHLGHVFNDGPLPTGLRYCINGLALKFIPAEDRHLQS